MTHPKSIRVLGRNVEIVRRPKKAMPNHVGSWHSLRMRINVREGQLPHDEADTLLHEVLHAILHCQGRENGGDEEETYVRAIATGLLVVLRENPEFTKWLVTETP